MSPKIGILTDSTADIPGHLQQSLGIHVIPVNLVIDGKTLRDGLDIKVNEFYLNFGSYQRMHSEPVAYEDYALLYKKLTHEYEELLCIHLSSKLSATYQTASQVHQDFQSSHDCRVTLIDSLQCSMGFGIPVMTAARMAQQGHSSEAIVRHITQMLRNMSTFFAVPDLKYLRRGKKISGLKSLVGMAMKVKPVISIENGENIVKTKLFGDHKNMILEMLEMIRDDIAGRPISLAVMQTAAEVSVVRNLREVFEAEFKCREVFDAYVSPSIGLNTGPASTGVIYYKHPLNA